MKTFWKNGAKGTAHGHTLPAFHPLSVLREWTDGHGFRVGDALTGVCIFGATGSGKSSALARHLALGYLAAQFGGVVLCSKKEERHQWESWAREAGREKDLVVFEVGSRWTFNFLDWEAKRAGAGGGLTLNIVALLDEIAGVLAGEAGKAEGGGDSKWFEDALHHMNMNLVDLPLFAGLPVTLKLLRKIVTTAPQSLQEAQEAKWQQNSACAAILKEADTKTRHAPAEVRADYEECRAYWLQDFPALSEKTRSIIALCFSMLVRPFITRPLQQLFSPLTSTITPESTFYGKLIIVDVPVQEFRLAGRLANMAWKYCFQVAVMRRTPPTDGSCVRPVFLWADEAQNFVSEFDAEYQAVARSAGGCTVYLTQNRESLRRVLGRDDAVDALLGNLQAKFFCQNSSIDTNEWAAKVFGERWTDVTMKLSSGAVTGDQLSPTRGEQVIQQRRYYIEPGEFATLRRGGARNDFQVDCFVYNGGELFSNGTSHEHVPYKRLTFHQGSL